MAPVQPGSSISSVDGVSPLRPAERIGANIVGVLLIAAGAVAVFVAGNGVGSVALVTAGALFLLVGIAGVIPTRFKLGENEVVLSRVREAQEAYGRGEEEEAEKIIDRLVRPRSPEGALTSLALERSGYELTVLGIIERHLPQGWEITRQVRTEHYRFDAVLGGAGRSNIAVEVFTSLRFTGGQLIGGLHAAQLDAILPIKGVLIIVANEDAPGLSRLRKGLEALNMRTEIIAWKAGDPETVVAHALSQILEF